MEFELLRQGKTLALTEGRVFELRVQLIRDADLADIIDMRNGGLPSLDPAGVYRA